MVAKNMKNITFHEHSCYERISCLECHFSEHSWCERHESNPLDCKSVFVYGVLA